jgi:hypothetical protein
MAKKAQGSTEYMAIMGISLLIMLVAVAFVAVEPQIAYSAKMQRSAEYWASARPFSLKSYAITQSHIILELQNSEPVSLSVKEIRLNGLVSNFSKIFAPYNGSAVPMCYSGSCDMQMAPGAVEVVLIGNLNSSSALQKLCSPDGSFQEGRNYEANLSITYQGSSGSSYVQAGSAPLAGQCVRISVNDTSVGTLPGPLTITTSSLIAGTVGEPYSEIVQATGCVGECAWSFFNLPWSPALQTGSAACVAGSSAYLLNGTPVQVKTATVVVTVTDYTRKTATKSLTLAIGHA